VRILAASNRNLRTLAEDGQFREDLYYRLSVVTIELPPLRERLEDIPLLAQHFLKQLAARYGITGLTISDTRWRSSCSTTGPATFVNCKMSSNGCQSWRKTVCARGRRSALESRSSESRIANINLKLPEEGGPGRDREGDFVAGSRKERLEPDPGRQIPEHLPENADLSDGEILPLHLQRRASARAIRRQQSLQSYCLISYSRCTQLSQRTEVTRKLWPIACLRK
jgi:hypothetical protein